MLYFNKSYTGHIHRHEFRRTIGEELFGANLLVTSAQPDGNLTTSYGYGAGIYNVGIKDLRYPGGTVTEYHFDMRNPEAEQSSFLAGQNLVPQRDFLNFAAEAKASVTFVIPTRLAFGERNDAWTALRNGTYGNRQVSEQYLDTVATWVEYTVLEAAQRGVTITAFEIGNEFWLSGEMTAAEYGRVASAVLNAANTGINRALDNATEENTPQRPDLVFQIMSNTGLMSPVNGSWVTRGATGMLQAARAGETDALWINPQGSLRLQQDIIVDTVRNSTSASLVNGLVDHFYTSGTLNSITSHHFIFWQFHHAEQRLGYSSGQLKRYITEWNTMRGSTNEINSGLSQASAMVEMIYQMSIHNIHAAHFWPLWFPTTNSTGMFDRSTFDLRIPAEVFKLMQESLIGTDPVLHSYALSGEHAIQSHGFLNSDKFVMFTSNRGSSTLNNFSADLSSFENDMLALGLGGQYFKVQTVLSAVPFTSGGTSELRPSITWLDGGMFSGDTISFSSLGSLGLVRTEITFVDDFGVRIEGRGGSDRIVGGRGNDVLIGGDGNDNLSGSAGNDWFFGEGGDDIINGGVGFDTAVFSGSFINYNIQVNWINQRVFISDTRITSRDINHDGSDVLMNIEAIEFADRKLIIDFENSRINGVVVIGEAASSQQFSVIPTVFSLAGMISSYAGLQGPTNMNGAVISFSGLCGTEVISQSDARGSFTKSLAVEFRNNTAIGQLDGSVARLNQAHDSMLSGEFISARPIGRIDGGRGFNPLSDPVINSSDALDILRMSIGLQPSFGRANSAHFVAADINRDGIVSSMDALDVLRVAAGLESTHQPRWVLFDGDIDFDTLGLHARNTHLNTGILIDLADLTSNDLSMTAILLGNVA